MLILFVCKYLIETEANLLAYIIASSNIVCIMLILFVCKYLIETEANLLAYIIASSNIVCIMLILFVCIFCIWQACIEWRHFSRVG
jgi:hypothetical protein